MIFLKPFGLFHLSSPPTLGEGSRRIFADRVASLATIENETTSSGKAPHFALTIED